MKKLCNIVAIFILSFLLFGCTKYSYTFDVDDNSLKIEETVSFDTSLIGANADLIQQMVESKINELKTEDNNGYSYENFRDNNIIGLKGSIEGDLKTIKNENLPTGFSTPQDSIVDITKGMLTTYYRVHLFFRPEILNQKMRGRINSFNQTNSNSFDASQNQLNIGYKTPENGFNDSNINEGKNFNPLANQDFSNLSQIQPTYNLVIKIPKKAKASNAQKVLDNNQYYWELSPSNETEIMIVYTRTDFSTVGSTLVIFFIIGVALHYFRKFRRKDDDD